MTCLEQIRHKLDSRENDYQFFCNYFHSEDFRKLLKVHSTVSKTDNGKSEAVEKNTADLAEQVVESLLPFTRLNKEIQELQHILSKPHLKGLLQAYDSIATADFNSIVPEDEVSSEEFLFHIDVKPEKDEVVVVENLEIKETEVEKYSTDMDDEKTTAGLTVVISRDQSSSSNEIEEIDDTDGNKIKENSDMDTSSVTVVDMRNENADVFHLNLTTRDNKKSTFEPVVTEEAIDNEMHVIESVQNVQVTRSDNIKEHDKVKEPNIHVGELKEEGTMEEATDNSVRTIRMFRNARETLGITVKALRNGGNTDRIIVARILSGGLADTFAALCIDDEILEINGRSVEGMTANEVADVMDGLTGSVDIMILPAKKDRKLTRETKVSLRALFDYNPLQDPLIPCKEVGIAFSTGDVLHVVNMDDANWWQGRKDGYSHDKAGLIPSKDFQEKRQQLNRIASSNDVTLPKDKNGKRALPFKKIGRKTDSNKILCNFQQDVKVDGWPAYEPVVKYLERPEKKRLLLLIGAPGVGRNEIKKMLLSSSPDKFITTVPHTSRGMKSYEVDGRDYFFVSRQTMENFIQKKKFIEFGEYRGYLYGTSKDSIKRAMKSGKTCVLKVQPEVMLLLRTAEFKPFCVFVKPPSLKELRSSRLTVQQKGKPASVKSSMRTFKEDELQEMISASSLLEDTYGCFFDLTVVNKDIEEAYVSVMDASERLKQEEHWVPLDWAEKN